MGEGAAGTITAWAPIYKACIEPHFQTSAIPVYVERDVFGFGIEGLSAYWFRVS